MSPATQNGSAYSNIGFVLSASGHPSVISPEYVGTIVLKHLLKLIATHLNHNQVNKAVIAVPAKFSSIQRAATGLAFRDAGLKVIRVLDEPTAAAVAYNLHKKKDIHHILVYDFGGGTLDVSILYVSQGSVQVYATDGDNFLGGSDFDMCLFNYIKSKLYKLTEGTVTLDSINATNIPKENPSSERARVPKLLCDSVSVREEAENIKKKLSTINSIHFECVYKSKNGNEEMVSLEVGRVDFEEECAYLFERGLIPVTRLLSDLDMIGSNIDEIVLVGGTTRIPFVKQKLKAFFSKDLNDKIDPDVTIAYGASSILT